MVLFSKKDLHHQSRCQQHAAPSRLSKRFIRRLGTCMRSAPSHGRTAARCPKDMSALICKSLYILPVLWKVTCPTLWRISRGWLPLLVLLRHFFSFFKKSQRPRGSDAYHRYACSVCQRYNHSKSDIIFSEPRRTAVLLNVLCQADIMYHATFW